MNLKELGGLFKGVVSAGADKALADSGALPDALTKAQAYHRYGRNNVERWLKEGLIATTKFGPSSKRTIDRLKLEAVARASNHTTYLPVAKR